MRLENVSKTANSSQTPRYLSWKCLDNFDKVSNEKMFYVPGAAISDSSRDVLRDLFGKMKEKWTKVIEDAFSDKKTHLVVSGGEYTFYFILPSVISAIRRYQPFTRIKMDRVEPYVFGEVVKADIDIAFGGLERTVLDYAEYIMNAFKNGYNHSRALYDDTAFFAASKSVVDAYGGDLLKTFEKHDFMSAHHHKDDKLSQRYAMLFKAGENVESRVVTDLLFYSYMLMLHSVGIWVVFSSRKWCGDVVILRQNPIVMTRFVLYKKNLNPKYRFINKILMRELRK